MHLMRKHCANAGFRFNIHTMQATEEPEKLRVQLEALTAEHRDLDDAISQWLAVPSQDELSLRRMKKHKLQLKDRIALIESMLEPDVPA